MGKQVNGILNEICTGLGYVRQKGSGYYIKPIQANIYSTICFNISSFRIKGHRFVAPIIGMMYKDVEELLREVSNSEMRCTNTISEHIGYIMPTHDWVEWDFLEVGTNSNAVVNDLRNALQKYSGIYCARFSNIYDVIESIEDKPLISANSGLFARLLIMYYLIGQKQKGVKFINMAFNKIHSELSNIFADEYVSNYLKLPDNLFDTKQIVP